MYNLWSSEVERTNDCELLEIDFQKGDSKVYCWTFWIANIALNISENSCDLRESELESLVMLVVPNVIE